MRLEILDQAERDLIEGFRFYEDQGEGLGSYFLTNLYADIDSLDSSAGIHSKPYKHYLRLLSRALPIRHILYSSGRHGLHPCGS
jgi:hypothetical protein